MNKKSIFCLGIICLISLTFLVPYGLSVVTYEFDTDGIAIHTGPSFGYRCDICSDGAGGAILAYGVRDSGDNDNIYAQRIDSDGNMLWGSNGALICNATGLQNFQKLVCDGAGGAIITWIDQRNPSAYGVYAQKINATGDVQWIIDGVPITISGTSSSFYPEICSDGAGGAIISWEDMGSTFDIYAQRINSTGDVQWTANGEPISVTTGSEMSQKICSDGMGGAIITWQDSRSGIFDIYTQMINSTGSVHYPTNGIAVCTALEEQWRPEICSDGLGGAIIIWEDDRTDTDGDIYGQRINTVSVEHWGPNGTAICTALDEQSRYSICSNGTFEVFITWEDRRNGALDIYAQKLNFFGIGQWELNGTFITSYNDDNPLIGTSSPQIISDSAGDAIIVWGDNKTRIGYNLDIYAQKVNSTGDMQWTTGGIPICNTTGTQRHPRICSDGSKGAFIAWDDYRSGYNLYAQLVKDGPAVPPPPNGQIPLGNYYLLFFTLGIISLIVLKKRKFIKHS